MADRPILFSAPMVRALLAGTKTQTRRPLYTARKIKPDGTLPKSRYYPDYPAPNGGLAQIYTLSGASDIAVGDRLWVKETWRTHRSWDTYKPVDVIPCSRIWYEADGRDNCDQHGKTRVSIFMPRWASRLTLTVTDVRVERLQDISEADAIAEGIYCTSLGLGGLYSIDRPGDKARGGATITRPAGWEKASHAYCHLWERINGKDSWEANPWVVAVSFDVREGNIDG